MLWTALSITWAAAPDLAWLATNRALLALAALVVAAAVACRLRRPGRALALGIAAAAAPPVCWALATRLAPAVGGERAAARLQEPLGYWNALAAVCAVAVPGVLLLAAEAAPGRRGAWRAPATAGAVVLLVLTCLMTLSRAGLLIALVAAAVTLLSIPGRARAAVAGAAGLIGAVLPVAYALGSDALTGDDAPIGAREAAGRDLAWRLAVGLAVAAGLAVAGTRLLERPRRGATAVAVLVVALAAVAAGGALGGAPAASAQGTQLDAVPDDPSRLTDVGGNLRMRWWGEAVRGWEEAPLTGAGAGGFRLVELQERRDGDSRLTTVEAHQVLLGTLSGTGLIGGLLLVAVVAGVVWAAVPALRRRRVETGLAIAVAAPLLLQAQVDWTASVPAVATLGAAAGGTLLVLGGPAGTVAPARRAEPALAAVIVLVAVLGVVSALLPWASAVAVRSSQEALARGDVVAALDRARLAAQLDPLSARPDWARAEALALRGERGRALAVYIAAAEDRPDDPAAWRRVALAARSGPVARAAWERALALDPQDPRARAGAAGG